MSKGVLEWRAIMEEEWEEPSDPTFKANLPPNANCSYCQGNATGNVTDCNVMTGNITRGVTYFPYYQHSLPVASSFILAYLFIFLLCMMGNGLVCLIVLRNRRMRTVTNLFILNLAVSDLLVGIFCIPTTLVDNLITGWPFSNVVCKMSGLVQGMSVSASVFTLVAIAVDRFRCIVHPFKAKLTLLVAKGTIALIWVLAFIIMCPSAVMLTVSKVKDHYMVYNEDYNHTYPLYSCYENWPQVEMRKVYTTVLFAHIYLAPLTLITLMYGWIGVKLYTTSILTDREHPRAAAPPHPAPPGGHQEGRPLVSQKKVKVIKMLIVVALLFMLSWLPLWTLMLLTDYGGLDSEQLELLTGYVFPFAHWLAFSNSTVNPVIYGYYNENFKRGFQAVCQSYSGSCCQFHLWKGTDGGGARVVEGRALDGGPARVCGPRDTGANSNPLIFGARNRVYTDGDLAGVVRLEMEWRRGMGEVGSSALYTEGLGAAGGRIRGVSNKMGVQTCETDKVTPGGSGVCQAWDQ
ncbi:neuropeptide FF receptor 1 like 2 [Anguilla anguilla]|uniref:neuropeptide FF receptor 1 like 2 n=1 Tax=Anguilla anguilla TaxID=7936 RepID=UPI0015AE03B7|nr:neuropeptide FF receptor 1 like 2 [Anguilla anguilla]